MAMRPLSAARCSGVSPYLHEGVTIVRAKVLQLCMAEAVGAHHDGLLQRFFHLYSDDVSAANNLRASLGFGVWVLG